MLRALRPTHRGALTDLALLDSRCGRKERILNACRAPTPARVTLRVTEAPCEAAKAFPHEVPDLLAYADVGSAGPG
jgi:hypothetical protein